MRVERDGPVVRAVLDNPARRNALTWAMYDELLALCDLVDHDASVRVVVVSGAGGAFAAGTDVRQFTAFTSGADGVAYERRVGRVMERLLAVRVPVVGVVQGPAVGAGLAVAAVCDVLVATPDARFGVPVARTLGNCLPGPVVARLQQRLGASRTTAMLLTARLLDAAAAQAAGFVHTVVEAEGLDDAVASLEQRLTGGAPLALAAFKEMDRRLAAAAPAVRDEDLLERCYGSADFREGVAAFLDHRPPQWEGR